MPAYEQNNISGITAPTATEVMAKQMATRIADALNPASPARDNVINALERLDDEMVNRARQIPWGNSLKDELLKIAKQDGKDLRTEQSIAKIADYLVKHPVYLNKFERMDSYGGPSDYNGRTLGSLLDKASIINVSGKLMIEEDGVKVEFIKTSPLAKLLHKGESVVLPGIQKQMPDAGTKPGIVNNHKHGAMQP